MAYVRSKYYSNNSEASSKPGFMKITILTAPEFKSSTNFISKFLARLPILESNIKSTTTKFLAPSYIPGAATELCSATLILQTLFLISYTYTLSYTSNLISDFLFITWCSLYGGFICSTRISATLFLILQTLFLIFILYF